jgi:uncharacterized ferredoxin-like protein
MSDPIGYEELRAETVLQAAKTMAGSAITAPKSGGQLFLQGKPTFLETVIVDALAARSVARRSGSATLRLRRRLMRCCSLV